MHSDAVVAEKPQKKKRVGTEMSGGRSVAGASTSASFNPKAAIHRVSD